MAVKLPDGSIVSLSSGYGPEKTIEAISNAANAVATLEAGHGLLANAILEITSGWSKLNGRIARVSAVAAEAATLEKIDTSNVTRFPAESGGGTVREITAWTQISQITGFETSGGDQQFTQYAFLESDEESQLPTTKSPTSIAITMADDPSLPHYPVLESADEEREPRVLRLQLPGGSAIYYPVYVSFNKTPTLTKGNIMTVKATASLIAALTRYAA